ncbi:unnamed protein product [Coregonus sp. 'balchen']|nr:unnamed protein product [Coregonus sp. 'balchen']
MWISMIQCHNLLDDVNDTLLCGHIEDQEELKAFRSNTQCINGFIVIDETVNQLYGSQVTRILPLPTTEETKSMELVTRILEEVHKFGIDRRSEPLIAIGGGMALMKHRGLFELLETVGGDLLDSSFQSCDQKASGCCDLEDAGSTSPCIAIETIQPKVLPVLLHGEAVNINMSFMVYKGLQTEEEKARISRCMVGLELPLWHQGCTLALVQKSLSEQLKHPEDASSHRTVLCRDN